jgi:hypothetical protein
VTSSVHAHPRHYVGRLFLLALALPAMLALAGSWAPTAAKADGDPASDVLATQQLFLPQDAAVPPAQQAQLTALLNEAGRGDYPIRAALIASATDLGSVTALWNQPQNYAQFLGQELGLVYHGPLLVVMPNGFGLYHVPKTATAQRALTGGPNPRIGIGAAAITAIRKLSAAAGHPLAPPTTATSNPGATPSSPTPWIVFATGALLIAAAWTASLRARPVSRPRKKPSSAPPNASPWAF